MSSAAGALQIALDSVISDDVALDGILAGQKVHSLIAVEGAPLPFVVLGDSGETNHGLFQRSAKDNVETIHIFSEQNSKEQVLEIYGHLERILNKTRIIVAGHNVVMGRLLLITVIGDPDGGTHLVARYEVLTTEAL